MKRTFIAFILIAVLMAAFRTGAHGYVVRAIPADRSTLERPPTRLQYWFSEELELRFSEIKLRDQSGDIIAIGGVDENNASLLSLRVPTGLPEGAYIVELRPAFVSDGHVIAESRVFFVGEEVGGVSGQAADDRAIPLEVLWRFLLSLANMLFFGSSALFGAALMPAWGSARRDNRQLPPRVMHRLRACLIASIVLALVANVIALLQQSMVFFNADAGKSFNRVCGKWCKSARASAMSGPSESSCLFSLECCYSRRNTCAKQCRDFRSASGRGWLGWALFSSA